MLPLILHHYDLSPFGEKVRLAFGHKGLSWRSVDIPIWPPRPDTEPLTAGYRRAPVLQIGADVYCDTMLILSEIERRHPEPTLYPDGAAALATALGWWADTTTFLPAALIATSVIGDDIPAEFLRDRVAFMRTDFSRAASLRDLPVNRQRVHAQWTLLAAMLGDGRPFLLGDRLSVADLGAYHIAWFVRQNGGPGAEALLPYGPLDAWMDRVAALGHGGREPLTPAMALQVAREAMPDDAGGVPADDPSGLSAGDPVRIVTDERGDPIRGTLVGASPREIVIRHESPQAGIVHVHFPRFGYSAIRDEGRST